MAQILQLKPSSERWRCSACGANAACDCNAPYISAADYAAKAFEANPAMSEMSDRAIAAQIGMDHKTVGKARKLTGEKSPVKRIGRDGKKRKVPGRNWQKVDTAEGKTISETCRDAMQSKDSMEEIAARLGWSRQTYARVLTVVMLADRNDLTSKQRQLVTEAITVLDHGSVEPAYNLVKPIAERIWGHRRGTEATTTEQRRLDDFRRSIGAICGACAACEHIALPFLSEDEVASSLNELKDATKELLKFMERIRRTRNG